MSLIHMTTVLNAFLTACGAGMVTFLVFLIKWTVKKMNADDLTMKAVAHDAYFRQCRYLLAKDEITEEELENHNYLYKAYKSQGLNGTGDRLHQIVLEKQVLVNVDPAIFNKLP